MSRDPENQDACPACGYVLPSPESLAKLDAGIESAKTRPLVTGESFAKYADDDAPEQLTTEERERLELLAGDLREVFTEEVAKLLRIHDAQRERIAELGRSLPDPREYLCTCGHLRGEPHRLGCGALP